MKRPKLHADGIARVFKRMAYERDHYLKPAMGEHWERWVKLPLPLTHAWWNLWTESCRIKEAAYFNGHVFGVVLILLALVTTALGALIYVLTINNAWSIILPST